MAATRRYLVVAVAVGVASTVALVVQAVLFAWVVDRALLHGATLGQVAPGLVGLAAAIAARALLGWLGQAAAHHTSGAVTTQLRRQLLRHALDLGPSWLSGERAGELSLTATRGIDALDAYFGRYLPQAVLAALVPVGILAWVAWEDWLSALILLALLAVVPPAMIFFGREARRNTERQWRRLASLSSRFLELVQGLPTLRAFGRAGQGRREVAAATEGLRVATMGTLRVAFLSSLALEALGGLATGLVAMALGLRLLGGTVALPTALAVLLVSPEVFLPLRRAGAEFHASAEGQAAADRVLDVLDLPAGVPGSGPAASTSATPAAAPPDGPLRLAGVTVSYPGRTTPALEGLDAVVHPGEHVAVVGPSGAGKSTLLAVLLGFVAPTGGSVMVGDTDLATVPVEAWREQLAWVPQRPHLFRGTLADNLRLGNPDASQAELRGAVDLAALGEVVDHLPAGLETPVGEDGLDLSAGERQRVAVARAVLRNPRLLLLDEPVAHLDPDTAEALRRSLSPWLEGRTVVVAGHRPERLGRLDRVIELAGDPAADTGPEAAGTRPGGTDPAVTDGPAGARTGRGAPA